MAILRMRRKRPDLKPEQYYDQDEDFKNFIDCKPCERGIARVNNVSVCVFYGVCRASRWLNLTGSMQPMGWQGDDNAHRMNAPCPGQLDPKAACSRTPACTVHTADQCGFRGTACRCTFGRRRRRADRPSARHTPLCTMYVGPGMEPRGYEDACPAARYYFRRKMGPPGGAICALANSTAACPHFD